MATTGCASSGPCSSVIRSIRCAPTSPRSRSTKTAGEINPEAFSYGYDRVRFIKPVFIGDTITSRCTVKEKRDDPKRPALGVVIELVEALNQRGETVLAAEHLLLVKRRG